MITLAYTVMCTVIFLQIEVRESWCGAVSREEVGMRIWIFFRLLFVLIVIGVGVVGTVGGRGRIEVFIVIVVVGTVLPR